MTSESFAVRVELPKAGASVGVTLGRPLSDAWGVVAIAHGAGTGKDHPFLVGFADALEAAGLATARFNFPYSEAGRRMPGPAAHAVATWAAVLSEVSVRVPAVPVFASGKSYGGRMASMAAAEGVIAPAALVYLGYPLHPPGAPEKPRVAHLKDVSAPQLFVSGTVDPFVQPVAQLEEAVQSCQDARIEWVPGGGHSFEVKGVKRLPAEVAAALVPDVVSWLRLHKVP